MDSTLERSPRRLSRRRALGLAAGAGAAAVAAPVITAAPLGAEAGRSPGYLAVPARVLATDGEAVAAEAIDEAQAPAEPWAAVPVAGFPWGLLPREGDHVSVTDGFQGLELAAVPLCSWVEGVPAASAGGYAVAGRQTVAAEDILGDPAGALADASTQGRVVAVCLADSDLADALVLQVRTPAAPASGTPGQ
jgi:hypothetical protein